MPINYFALLVATIAAYVVGWLWYGPLFGKQWRRLMNIPEGPMKMPPTKVLVGGLVSTLLMIYVLANMVAAAGTLAQALVFTAWVWFGFIAMVMVSTVLYENRSWQLYFINISHYLAALLIAAAILAAWP